MTTCSQSLQRGVAERHRLEQHGVEEQGRAGWPQHGVEEQGRAGWPRWSKVSIETQLESMFSESGEERVS